MARFIDRLRGGKCRPLSPLLLVDSVEHENNVRWEIAELAFARHGRRLTDVELDRLTATALANAPTPTAVERADLRRLSGVPVIAADDVSRYCQLLPDGTDVSSVVATMAPPFDRFFIDVEGVPNAQDWTAWGVLVEATERPDLEPHPGDDGVPRWVLSLTTFVELRPWVAMGPVATHVVGLAEDGTWFRHADGLPYFGGGMPAMEPQPPADVSENWVNSVLPLVVSALLTVSLMHCRNVDVRTVEPDEQESRRNRRRHGHRLVRYQTLDIEPMRRLLDDAGARDPGRGGLRRALTLCRGHFKVFTEDAPLFGRHAGQYWWAPHVRGAAQAGIVINDYRVHAPVGLPGRPYRTASEKHENVERDRPGSDPDEVGEGRVAHNRAQNWLASVLTGLGFPPRSPIGAEPEYDLAWSRERLVWVAEVKSITPTNEERQLRTAMGQVLRYRQKLASLGHEVQAVIFMSNMPTDVTWDALCQWEGIVLAWPEVATDRLGPEVSPGSPWVPSFRLPHAGDGAAEWRSNSDC